MQNKPYLRYQRVSELIKEELGMIMVREMNFEGALVTIVDVEVTDKLDYAKVHISTIPDDRAEESVKRLTSRLPYLQHLLLKKINIKPMPNLSFVIDRGNEKAAGVERALLDEEHKNS